MSLIDDIWPFSVTISHIRNIPKIFLFQPLVDTDYHPILSIPTWCWVNGINWKGIEPWKRSFILHAKMQLQIGLD